MPPADWGDEPVDWQDPPDASIRAADVAARPLALAATPITRRRRARWGGNMEIISWLLQAGRVGPSEGFDGGVLFLETSEELPPAVEVYRILRNMGERGLLQRFPALIWSRPKAWERGRQNSPEQKRAYVDDQYAAVRQAMAEYHPDALMVLGVDLGHADPQLIIPYGGTIRVDGPARRISVRY